MSITVITDHNQEAINRLLGQFRNKDNIEDLLTIFTEQIQDLETCNTQLVTLRLLGTASGVQLDQFGKVVGQLRGGRNDEDYRIVLAGKIGVNNSEGTAEELISTFHTYSDISDFQYFPYYPAACQIITDSIPVYPGEWITDGDMEAAGVASWTPINSATLTKSLIAPYAGTQSLRIAYNGVNDPAAQQTTLVNGAFYWLRGRIKTQNIGVAVPRVWNGGGILWSGVPWLAWQEFNVIFQATHGNLSLGANFTVPEWIEYDSVSCTRVKKDYADEIFDICQRVIGAGVELIQIVYYDGQDESFAFQGGPLGLGFGSVTDPTIGGKLSSLF